MVLVVVLLLLTSALAVGASAVPRGAAHDLEYAFEADVPQILTRTGEVSGMAHCCFNAGCLWAEVACAQ